MLWGARRHRALVDLPAHLVHSHNGVGGLVRVDAEHHQPACCRACHLGSLVGLVALRGHADEGPAGRHTSVEAIAMLL